MTSPRSSYGGSYSSHFPDTPIYDSLVAERGTPQIAPIRVPLLPCDKIPVSAAGTTSVLAMRTG
uniref:DUF6643 family protein n=1 Tax=Streptomyces otsuchiensis TaxID=2681388 RepID=UPI0034D96757